MKKSLSPSNGALSLFCTVGVLALVSSATQGATLTGVTIEDVSSELVAGFDRGAIRLLDGSGFDEALGTHNVTPDGNQGGGMWLNNGTFANPNDPNAPGAVITFDLGGSTALNSVTIWNYNETARPDLVNRGANAAQILVAS
ncbi:MAG: hypothetical protein ACPGQF_07260, partial [Akkermansiaceae bacterium]